MHDKPLTPTRKFKLARPEMQVKEKEAESQYKESLPRRKSLVKKNKAQKSPPSVHYPFFYGQSKEIVQRKHPRKTSHQEKGLGFW